MTKSQAIALANYKSACEQFDQIISSGATLEQREHAETECRERYAQLINTVELDYTHSETISSALRRTFPEL